MHSLRDAWDSEETASFPARDKELTCWIWCTQSHVSLEKMLFQCCSSLPGSIPAFTLGSPQSISRAMLSACSVDHVHSPAGKPLRWLSLLLLFSPQVVSDFSTLHRLQHARLPCPSPSPGICSNSCPLSWWSNHFIFCRPLLLLPSIFPSIRVFSNESVLCMRWPKYWSFSFSISPSNEHPGLISFRRDWLDLLTVLGTLKSLLQHHSSSALSFHYSLTLPSIHDHWKSHSLN